MIEVYFEDLNSEFIKSNKKSEVKIIKDNIDFYIKLNIKENNNYLIAFSNGAINPSKKKPPVFMRNKWAEDFNASSIFIDDRTTHDYKLRIGWGIGTPERHYLRDYVEIIKKISDELDIDNNKIAYYGSSAGGFMSISMAILHKGTTAIVNNPQTYVKNYNKFFVDQIYYKIFSNQKPIDILKEYSERFSILNLMSRKKYVPKIFYLQNRKCRPDMINQVVPFFKNADRYKVDLSNLNMIYYNNAQAGHNPLNREKTVKYVNNLIENEFEMILK